MILRLIVMLLILSSSVLADSWKFKEEVKKDEFHFNDIKVVKIRDSRSRHYNPEWTLEIYRSNNLLAKYKGFSFDHIYSDKNHSIFIALSNTGLKNAAIIIFDSEGSLLFLRDHNESKFKYCEQSVTLIREWYDPKNPSFEFQYDLKGNISRALVKGCDGKTIDVLGLVKNI